MCHRRPLPVALWKAMVVLAVAWRWPRLAGVLIFTFSAPCRVGEYPRSLRRNLSLPRDFLEDSGAAYLEVRQPKTAGRGGARTQHARVTDIRSVRFLDGLLGELPAAEPLYPLSSSSPMGWTWSLYFAQQSNCARMQSIPALRTIRVMSDR